MPGTPPILLIRSVRRFTERLTPVTADAILTAKSEPVPEVRTEQYYKKRPCAEMVKMAAEIMEQYIRENPIDN